jgi:hypothetical protein
MNSKTRGTRVRPTADSQHRKQLLHPSSIVKRHTRHPKRNKRSIEGNSASFASPRIFHLRSVSSGLSFFTAIIQTEHSTLDPPHKELEQLIKGSLGYVVKVEDISLQLLASGMAPTWLITGFTQDDATSRYDATSMQVSATLDMQALQQTADAATREVANTTDSEDSDESGDSGHPEDQILDSTAATTAGAAVAAVAHGGVTGRRRYPPWDPLDDQRLLAYDKEKMPGEEMAEKLERTTAAVRNRLYILKERSKLNGQSKRRPRS